VPEHFLAEEKVFELVHFHDESDVLGAIMRLAIFE
jgi:hypothetical protein